MNRAQLTEAIEQRLAAQPGDDPVLTDEQIEKAALLLRGAGHIPPLDLAG